MCDIPNSKGLDKNVWTFEMFALKMISRLTQQRLGGLAFFFVLLNLEWIYVQWISLKRRRRMQQNRETDDRLRNA